MPQVTSYAAPASAVRIGLSRLLSPDDWIRALQTEGLQDAVSALRRDTIYEEVQENFAGASGSRLSAEKPHGLGVDQVRV